MYISVKSTKFNKIYKCSLHIIKIFKLFTQYWVLQVIDKPLFTKMFHGNSFKGLHSIRLTEFESV